MKKLIRDGKVAVLVSHGFGAGWFTWNYDEPQLLYDPVIVEMLEQSKSKSKIEQYCKEQYPNAYLDGLDGLCVEWLPIGTTFRIHEYDGSESVEIRDSVQWKIA
jgi:hypothetical protein